ERLGAEDIADREQHRPDEDRQHPARVAPEDHPFFPGDRFERAQLGAEAALAEHGWLGYCHFDRLQSLRADARADNALFELRLVPDLPAAARYFFCGTRSARSA